MFSYWRENVEYITSLIDDIYDEIEGLKLKKIRNMLTRGGVSFFLQLHTWN